MAGKWIKSSEDKVTFSVTLAHKTKKTRELYARQGIKLDEPKAIAEAMAICMPMVKRYGRGMACYHEEIAKGVDPRHAWQKALPYFKHTMKEAQAEHQVSLFVVNAWQRINKHKEVTNPDWSSDFPEEGKKPQIIVP